MAAIFGRIQMTFSKVILGAITAGSAVCALASAAAAGEFDGVTVNILTRPGYVIAGPLKERGVDFEKMQEP